MATHSIHTQRTICVLLLLNCFHGNCVLSADLANVTFFHEDVAVVTERETYAVKVNYTCWTCHDVPTDVFQIGVVVTDEAVARIQESRLPALNWRNSWTVHDAYVNVSGVFIGKTSLDFIISQAQEETIAAGPNVNVLRPFSPLDTAFTVVVAVLVAINTIAFACALDLKVVIKYLKKPIGVSIGFVCQYVFMPLIAFGLAKAFSLQESLAFGLLCYGSSPGGGFSNIYTILLRGDINLSITMTLTSTLTSLAMTSLWLFTLGRVLNSNVSIPYGNILISLGSLVITCVIGLLIGKYLPKVAKILKKIIRPLAGIVILFILTVGIYTNIYIFRLMGSWRIALSSVLVSYAGYVISFCVAVACRQPWKIVRTIVIETGVQNGGIALIILRASLPQPDADLATVAPIMAMMTSSLPLIVAVVVTLIMRRVRGDKGDDDDVDEEDAGEVKGYSNPAMSEYFKKLDESEITSVSASSGMETGYNSGRSAVQSYFSKLGENNSKHSSQKNGGSQSLESGFISLTQNRELVFESVV